MLHLTANRSPAAAADWLAGLADWKFPQLEPLDTAGQVAVLGVVVGGSTASPRKSPPRAWCRSTRPRVAGAIPASVLKAEPGAPAVRQVVSYYAPAGDYSLAASFVRPPAGLKVAANSLLVIGDQGLTLQGGLALTPQAESLFEFRFVAACRLASDAGHRGGRHAAADRALSAEWRRHAGRRAAAQGIPVGQTQTVNYQAMLTPAGWLTEWTTQKVEFPKVLVAGRPATAGRSRLRRSTTSSSRPDDAQRADAAARQREGGVRPRRNSDRLAYRFDESRLRGGPRRRADCAVNGGPASIRSSSCERDNLLAHYELNYDVREARTRQVAFSLPIGTPTELTIRGLESTAVKQFSSQDQGDRRRWTVQLAERQIGRVRLAIDFTQRLPEHVAAELPAAAGPGRGRGISVGARRGRRGCGTRT